MNGGELKTGIAIGPERNPFRETATDQSWLRPVLKAALGQATERVVDLQEVIRRHQELKPKEGDEFYEMGLGEWEDEEWALAEGLSRAKALYRQAQNALKALAQDRPVKISLSVQKNARP